MEATLKARLKWVKLYEETSDAGYVCRRCGIPRPTLRKWVKRCQSEGISGLADQSKKPHLSPNKKVDSQIIQWVTELRNERNLGARRIQSELFRQYQCSLSLSTIHKILVGEQRVVLSLSLPISGLKILADLFSFHLETRLELSLKIYP